MSDVGTRIRELRERRGWTLRELAEVTGFSYSMLGHIERGHREGSISTIQTIADALGVSVGILIDASFDLDRAVEYSRLAEASTHLDDHQWSVVLDMIDALRRSQ